MVDEGINGPAWLQEKRKSAWKRYVNEPVPDRVSHLWRYSDPLWFDLNGKEITSFNSDKVQIFYENVEDDIKNSLVIGDLNQFSCDKKYSDLVSELLGVLVKENKNRLAVLNEAIWTRGYFIYVPKAVKIEKPVIIKTANNETDKYSAIRCLIILEEDSSLNLIDEISSNNGCGVMSNVVTEIFLREGSRLNYLNIQSNSLNTIQHVFQKASLQSKAMFNNLIVALGGKTTKVDLQVALHGSYALTSVFGIVLGNGSQIYDHHTLIDHLTPNTESELNFRVVLNEKASSAYTGNLKISHDAVKSNAIQENRNLLLSGEAKAESIPELEILTNDVTRCSHGVTISQVDKDQIYYLMSRGIDEHRAEEIIAQGFLEPTLSKIPEGVLKEELLKKIKTKLENL